MKNLLSFCVCSNTISASLSFSCPPTTFEHLTSWFQPFSHNWWVSLVEAWEWLWLMTTAVRRFSSFCSCSIIDVGCLRWDEGSCEIWHQFSSINFRLLIFFVCVKSSSSISRWARLDFPDFWIPLKAQQMLMFVQPAVKTKCGVVD